MKHRNAFGNAGRGDQHTLGAVPAGQGSKGKAEELTRRSLGTQAAGQPVLDRPRIGHMQTLQHSSRKRARPGSECRGQGMNSGRVTAVLDQQPSLPHQRIGLRIGKARLPKDDERTTIPNRGGCPNGKRASREGAVENDEVIQRPRQRKHAFT